MKITNSKKRILFFAISILFSLLGVSFLVWRMQYGGIAAKNITSMTIDMLGVLLMTIEIGGCLFDKAEDTKVVDSFTHFLMVMAFMWFTDMITWGIDGINTDFAVALAMIVDSLYYFCNLMVIAAFILYISKVVHLNRKRLKIYTVCFAVIFTLLLILMVLNIWLPIFFEIRDGIYYRLPPTNAVLIIGALLLVATLYVIGDSEMDKVEKVAIGVYVFLPLGFLILQMISYGFAFIPMSAIVATGVIYVHMYLHQSKIMEEQRNEILKNRTTVMLSQIQPHFLFNSLSTIVALCDLDPQLAKQTTLDFSTYLECNLNSLTEMEVIPFERELEQVKAYINIEKARFGDYLNVQYDLKATNFMVPSLTVQPMVENAVKHGIQAMPQGGTVWISSFEGEDNWTVQIKDNGCGFDSEVKEAEGFGIGISNTRKRLEVMCGGELIIIGQKGIGTVVQILIPKEN